MHSWESRRLCKCRLCMFCYTLDDFDGLAARYKSNMPCRRKLAQSVIVVEPNWCCCWIVYAGSRRMYVESEEQNLNAVEITLLHLWIVPDWHGSKAWGSRCDPPTSPSITVLTISVDAPGQLWSALTHTILLRISPKSFKKWTPTSGLPSRSGINNWLATPLVPRIVRLEAVEGTYGLELRCRWYVSITEVTRVYPP